MPDKPAPAHEAAERAPLRRETEASSAFPVVFADRVHYAAEDVEIVREISLSMSRGEFVALVGPSGCGKTTFLNLVAGLDRPTDGTLLVNNAPPTPTPQRAMYAFARDALLPWRTAVENVALPLEILGISKARRQARAAELLTLVGLKNDGDRYRAELSQGMRQRVALARALAPSPDLLVMDEPFAALDAQTRVAMQRVLLDVLETERTSVIFVTHDLAEAITLADRVLLFSRRPCAVRESVTISLDRPRDGAALRTQSHFHGLYDRMWEVLREETAGLGSRRGQ